MVSEGAIAEYVGLCQGLPECCRLPGLAGRALNLQQLVRDPAHIVLPRLQVYSSHVKDLLDEARGDPSAPAAKRASDLALEFLTLGIAKAGRV